MKKIKTISTLLLENNPVEARVIIKVFDKLADNYEFNVVKNSVVASDYLFKRGDYNEAKTPGLIILNRGSTELIIEIKNDAKLNVIPLICINTQNKI
ncbi:MAG: hypothetical protein Kow0019_11680 [Methanobacteriaceae archaeon]